MAGLVQEAWALELGDLILLMGFIAWRLWDKMAYVDSWRLCIRAFAEHRGDTYFIVTFVFSRWNCLCMHHVRLGESMYKSGPETK